MAVKAWTKVVLPAGHTMPGGTEFYECTLASGDESAQLLAPQFADKHFTVTGTFSGTTVAAKGSDEGNPADTTNFVALHDPAGNAASVTAAGCKQLLENTLRLILAATGGTGTGLVARVGMSTTARR
jgi:hypothetical protein